MHLNCSLHSSCIPKYTLETCMPKYPMTTMMVPIKMTFFLTFVSCFMSRHVLLSFVYFPGGNAERDLFGEDQQQEFAWLMMRWLCFSFVQVDLFDEDGDANDDDLLVSHNNCVLPRLVFFSWCSFDFTVGKGESILMYLFTINCTIALLGKQNMIINNKGHQRASIQEQQKGRLKRYH